MSQRKKGDTLVQPENNFRAPTTVTFNSYSLCFGYSNRQEKLNDADPTTQRTIKRLSQKDQCHLLPLLQPLTHTEYKINFHFRPWLL
ncbi:uncharacterized protein DS421_3g96160 [Arachis hypogaea]|nr:uncharacterized protein DS421_3g96160 [Arachis hypogaea]